MHNKFDRELADRNLTISLQRLDDAKLKRLVVLTQLRVEGHEDTIATLTTELQLLSDELQRVYSAHQATLQQLAEKHIELTHVRQALDAAATQADGEQAQLASTLRDMQADADSLRNHCKDLSAQLDAAKQQQQATTQVMAELQARHNDAQQQLKSAQAANKAQAQQHATALQRLEEKLQAERTNATLNQQRAEAQEAAVKNLETLLKQGNRVVDEAVASQKQAMAVNQEHVDMLKAQNAQLKKELQAEWQRNSRLEWELAQLRALEPAAPRAPHQGRDVAAHAFRAIESCIDATADSGGSPHGAGAHRPLLPVHAEPSMSSPGDARAAKAGAYTVSANASTPLPRDVAAAGSRDCLYLLFWCVGACMYGTGSLLPSNAAHHSLYVATEAVFVHHANDEARRGQQLGDKHYEPSDLQPITLPQHSMKASEEPSPPPKAKGKGKGSGSKGTTARGSKRKAAADAAAEDDEDDEVEEEEEPTTRAAARKGAGKGKGAAKAAKTGTARRSSVPRSNIRAKQGSRLPLVEEEEVRQPCSVYMCFLYVQTMVCLYAQAWLNGVCTS